MSGAHAPEQLQREIEQIQARISATMGVIRRRLSFRQLKDQASTMDKNTDTEGRYRTASSYYGGSSHRRAQMGDMVRNNPIPLAMIGLGIGWLVMSNTTAGHRMMHSDRMRGWRNQAGHLAEEARHRVRDAMDSVRDTAEDLRERASDGLQSARERVTGGGQQHAAGDGNPSGYGQSAHGFETSSGSMSGPPSHGQSYGMRAREYSQGIWQMVDDHPVVAGLMGMALGAAIGASLPSTDAEQRWLGDVSRDVWEGARELGREAADRAAAVAQAGAEASRQEAERQAGDVNREMEDRGDTGSRVNTGMDRRADREQTGITGGGI